jgi:tetrahydromethanopterin S-methyltransferase subunit G
MARVTIDTLAGIMKMSFDDLKEDLTRKMENGFAEVDMRFDEVDKRFDKVEYRLDVIEGKLINNHENRIVRLEDEVRVIKTKNK